MIGIKFEELLSNSIIDGVTIYHNRKTMLTTTVYQYDVYHNLMRPIYNNFITPFDLTYIYLKRIQTHYENEP